MNKNLEALKNRMLEEKDELTTYYDRLPPEKKLRINGQLANMKTGLHAVAPLKCGGPKVCVFIAHCPIPDRGEDGELIFGPDSHYPKGLDCILEAGYMKNKVMEYFIHLDVDPHNPVETALVNELALIDLYKNRTLMILSSGDKNRQGQDLLLTDITGYTDNGHPLTSTQLHPAMEAMDKLERRRKDILSKMNEFRKDKLEMNHKLGISKDSGLFDQLEKIRKALEAKSSEPLEIEEDLIEIK